MNIAVIGLGYIGLPTATLFASRKVHVQGIDVQSTIVDKVNAGEIHIIEPDLDMIVRSVVNEGYLQASDTLQPADVFIIAVPTPFKEDYQPDLSYIIQAAHAIAPVLQAGNLVILESTSPVGTTESLSQWMAALRPDLKFPMEYGDQADIRVAYCPERVLPGHIMKELVQNDRVMGGITALCAQKAKEVYQIFVTGDCFLTDARTAELCKLTENSYRDVNIAFANELSMVCDKLDVNVWELIRLANRHPRVNILQPGPGVGGHCIAVDPWFIVSSAPQEAKLIKTAREVNDAKSEWVIQHTLAEISAYLQTRSELRQENLIIACFGLAYKADIDDLRESPSVSIAIKLSALHPGPLLVVEPNIVQTPEHFPAKIELCHWQEALEKSAIVLLLVDHKEFKNIPLGKWKQSQVIDLRGVLPHA